MEGLVLAMYIVKKGARVCHFMSTWLEISVLLVKYMLDSESLKAR